MLWLEYWLFSTALFWAGYSLWALGGVLSIRPLRPRGSKPVHEAQPQVRAVVAARDDAATIERTLTDLTQQVDVDLRVVVCEGPSVDDTPARIQRMHGRVDHIPMQAPPAGWLGKCHALHAGASGSEAWLLFVDADVRMDARLVADALAEATREQAAHVAIYPRQGAATLWGQAALYNVGAGMAVVSPGWLVRRRGAAAGLGHFNLVRRDVYEQGGGHAALRMEIVDDVALGRMVRRHGGRTLLRSGQDRLQADWASTFGHTLSRMEKNAFAGLGYRTTFAVAACGFFLAMMAGGPLGWWAGGPYGYAAGALWLGHGVVGLAQAASRRGWGDAGQPLGRRMAAAALTPLSFAAIPALLLRSTWRTLRNGGVSWRGSHYALRALREGRYR